ncbi:MAG: SPOR domain-containing protein [Tepidimonas sp.]|uniref:SPOR domain-containing protein n=1 Tax=Tepidimonas sp. TaxID=2002775 RepID=UPI00259ECED9|nr:SPOR domain-containing protein [Tepidimonas sp.]MDM7457608.1 SPOR domain-containing protein [Tepidimonas sp.]
MAFLTASLHRLSTSQRGGTLLGFMLGLVVGVGLALAVAVYVTKVPIPLVNRDVQRKPSHPETEAERLKRWNPNAGLSSAQPKGLSESGGSATDAPAAAEPPKGDPPRADTDAEGGKADAGKGEAGRDPIAELIRQRAGLAQPARGESDTVTAATDPFNYFVQVGAFRNAEEAEGQRARLALLGFDAKVSEREQAGQRIYRVRLGPFGNKVEAEVMQERLRAKQIDTALVRVQR